RHFIVEMQMHWTESFKSRVLFNASKAYVKQLKKSTDFKLLQPVYALSFVNETFNDSPDYYHHYKIVNLNDTEQQIKGLEFIFIELPKFRPQNRAERKLHELWLRFLTEIENTTEEIDPELFTDEDIEEAIKYAEVSAYSKAELDAYDDLIVGIVTVRSAISDYILKGKEEGIAEGRAEGIEEQNIKIACNLLKKGMSVYDIADTTGLTVAEIQSLK
ncbi:MAG: Rpn family recombination-promoting nuclease/putative transposase, partial [Prevotellaceae bacterium]|nr:Rpn family recombination-promoting nuclease/putative transposase [Prevotellaceae bacterium]